MNREEAQEMFDKLLDEIFGEDKPEFKEGDWVWDKHQGIARISEIENDYYSLDPKWSNEIVSKTGVNSAVAKRMRHATPSEIEAYKKEDETVRVWFYDASLTKQRIVSTTDPAVARTTSDLLGYTDIKIKDLKK